MVLDNLGQSLKNALKKIAGLGFVDKRAIEELVKEIQKALIQSDVHVALVLQLTQNIKKRAFDEKVPSGLTQKEYLIKIVYEELVAFLGKEKRELTIEGKPGKILLVGLFGSGKTTTAAKLASYYKTRGKKVALLALDVHRLAAVDQLEQLGKKIDVPVFSDRTLKNPVQIYRKFISQLEKYDLVLIDTAGRDALSLDLITEIENLNKEIKPQERLLVISGDIGQAAQKQAEQFHKSIQVTGVIVTKMDGTAKGGGALVACAVSGAPIVFLGVGETIRDLESFSPTGFVGRLLGMGDLEQLLEKAETIDKEKAEDLGKKLLKGDFNLLDLYEQMNYLRNMGPLNKLMEMIPGMGSLPIPKDMLEGQEDKIKKWKFILQSMTKKELENPEIITGSRVERIAKGSGTSVHEVRELLKQYNQMKKMMKMMKGKDPSSFLKKFKGKLPF